MKIIDPLQLQRLVDGELADDEVQQLLAEANQTPDHWQQIAVGFVENQSWNRAFNGRKMGAAVASIDDAILVDHEGGLVVPGTDVNGVENQQLRRNDSWLVMAAMLLVAATIGYMANEVRNRDLPVVVAPVEQAPPVSSPLLTEGSVSGDRTMNDVLAPQPRMTQADYHLEVPQQEMGELASAGPLAPVPLFAVNSLEQLKRLNKQQYRLGISPKIVEQFAGSGYQMEQHTNYISGRLDDGRSFVVPVRTIRFLPGQ